MPPLFTSAAATGSLSQIPPVSRYGVPELQSSSLCSGNSPACSRRLTPEESAPYDGNTIETFPAGKSPFLLFWPSRHPRH